MNYWTVIAYPKTFCLPSNKLYCEDNGNEALHLCIQHLFQSYKSVCEREKKIQGGKRGTQRQHWEVGTP